MMKQEDVITNSGVEKETAFEGYQAWLQRRLEWFMDQRFGCILHWGPCSQWDCIHSWPLVPADQWARPNDLVPWIDRGKDLERFSRDYRALNRTFNPVEFDPDHWAKVFKDAGMRYVALTTKHHDGFCLFDTDTTTFRSTHPDCPFHSHPYANIVRSAFDAFRKQGLAISCYFSKSDWSCPWYWAPEFPIRDRNPNYDTRTDPRRWAKFVEFTHRQVEELMTAYGPVDVLWLDGNQVRPPNQDIRMADLAAMARKHQPGLLIADRGVGEGYEDFITPEKEIPEKRLKEPWESCVTLGNAWNHRSEDDFKTATEVIRMLVDAAAKGGNLLLGVGPDALGRIPRDAERRLAEIGEWLRTNGKAIYGTRPLSPYLWGSTRFTRNGNVAYAIVFNPGAEVQANRLRIFGPRPAPDTALAIPGDTSKLSWTPTDEGFEFQLQQHSLVKDFLVLEYELPT